MMESVGGMVGSVTGAVGSVGGYMASSVGSMVGYGTSSPRPEEKRTRIPEGSGIVPVPSRTQSSTTPGEKKKNSTQRTDSSGTDDREVAHAIGGKHIERGETDVEGEHIVALGTFN